jgi:hypothetical protein
VHRRDVSPPNFKIKGNKLVFPEERDSYYCATPQTGTGNEFFDYPDSPECSSQRDSFNQHDNFFYNPTEHNETLQNESVSSSFIGSASKKTDSSYSRNTTHNLGRNFSKGQNDRQR